MTQLTVKSKIALKVIGCCIISLMISQTLSAHVVVGELEKMSKTDAALLYLQLGYQHIIPQGFDHILFVLSLFLLSPKLKPLLFQATAFTVAHSVTLGLVMYHVITPPASIVEPVIALSIMYVAIENIISSKLKTSRIGIVFLFGLVHGMGFANTIRFILAGDQHITIPLLGFNLGLEAGQVLLLTIILFISYITKKNIKNLIIKIRIISTSTMTIRCKINF